MASDPAVDAAAAEIANVVIDPEKKDIYHGDLSFQDMGLPPAILEGILKAGFKEPTRIQSNTIPKALAQPRRNLIAQAPAGSGKTLGFSIPLLSQMDESKLYPQGLVCTPTRELAIQVCDVMKSIAACTQIRFFLALSVDRNNPEDVQAAAQRNPIPARDCQVIIGTAGSVRKVLADRLDLSKISVFVCDEADKMLEQDSKPGQKGTSMGQDTMQIGKSLKNAQVMLFSATFAPNVRMFANNLAPNSIKELLPDASELKLEKVAMFYMPCKSPAEKYTNLKLLMDTVQSGQVMIFVNTIAAGKELFNALRQDGSSVALLHGKLPSVERDKVMNDFSVTRSVKYLIATNVLARGIDNVSVSTVINFDVPTFLNGDVDYPVYVHRVGRTGRFGRKGLAVNLVVDGPREMKTIRQLEIEYKSAIPVLNSEDPEAIEQIVKAALV